MAAALMHGGGLMAARRAYTRAPEPWLDLSTGINPVAYPIPPLPADCLARLPDPADIAALEAVAADAYGVRDAAAVVAGPGTQAIIHGLPRLLPPGRVAVLSPTYAEHHAAWKLAGHSVQEIETLQDADAAVIVVVRPNNPDGSMANADALLGLARPDRLVVVDEAFADLEGCSLASALPHPGLLLLRSFGKTYGLAGVRLGFALTAPALAATIRDALGPWAVSGPAMHAASHALPDDRWRGAAAARLQTDAARLDGLLEQAGCRVIGGTRLFRLVRHPSSAALAARLAHAGILVRQFEDRPGLLRFGLPGPATDWVRLRAGLL